MLSRVGTFVQPSRFGAQAILGARGLRSASARADEGEDRHENRPYDRRGSGAFDRSSSYRNDRRSYDSNNEGRARQMTRIYFPLPDPMKDVICRVQEEYVKRCNQLKYFRVPRSKMGMHLPAAEGEGVESKIQELARTVRKCRIEVKPVIEAAGPAIGIPIVNVDEVGEIMHTFAKGLGLDFENAHKRIALFKETEKDNAVALELQMCRAERNMKVRDEAPASELERLNSRIRELVDVQNMFSERVSEIFRSHAQSVDVANYLTKTNITLDRVLVASGKERAEIPLK